MTNEQFREKVRVVASILSYSILFDIDPNKRTAILSQLTSKAKLHIRNGGWKNEGRIRISGEYPQSVHWYRHERELESISITETKTAVTIAAEIQRRLFPKYLPEFEKAITSAKEHDEYIDTRLANIKSLASIAGAKFYHDPPSNREPSFRFGGDGDYGHIVKPDGKDRIRIELRRLTLGQATRVIEALKSKHPTLETLLSA